MNKLLKWAGGKHYIFRKNILPLIQPHDVYISGFFGGGSDILDKPVSREEIAFDVNPRLINLWKFVKEHPHELYEIVKNVEHTNEQFQLWNYTSSQRRLDAAAYLITNRLSRDGQGKTYAHSKRTRRGMPENQSSWETAKSSIPEIGKRMANVDIREGDFIKSLSKLRFKNKRVCIYADPPYPHETRKSKSLYEFEMTIEQHEELLKQLVKFDGQVLISSYENDLYESYLNGWNKLIIPTKVNMGLGKKNGRVEVVYYNWSNR